MSQPDIWASLPADVYSARGVILDLRRVVNTQNAYISFLETDLENLRIRVDDAEDANRVLRRERDRLVESKSGSSSAPSVSQ